MRSFQIKNISVICLMLSMVLFNSESSMASFAAAFWQRKGGAFSDCSGTPAVGTICTGGTVYVGNIGAKKYMMIPGGCGAIPAGQSSGGSTTTSYPTSDFTVTCSGNDSVTKDWDDASGNWYDVPGITNLASAADDPNTGSANTTALAALSAPAEGGYHAAALYCDKLNFAGYTDWYLPNIQELNLIYSNRTNFTGLITNGSWYWASSEYDNTYSWAQRFSDGNQTQNPKFSAFYIRCVRDF